MHLGDILGFGILAMCLVALGAILRVCSLVCYFEAWLPRDDLSCLGCSFDAL